MTKSKKRRTKKVKQAGTNEAQPGREKLLASLLDNPMPLYATYKGKEYQALALTSGLIKLDEVEYPTPSAAARAILGNNEKGKPLQIDGWNFWKFNKNGERVPLTDLRTEKDIHRRSEKSQAA